METWWNEIRVGTPTGSTSNTFTGRGCIKLFLWKSTASRVSTMPSSPCPRQSSTMLHRRSNRRGGTTGKSRTSSPSSARALIQPSRNGKTNVFQVHNRKGGCQDRHIRRASQATRVKGTSAGSPFFPGAPKQRNQSGNSGNRQCQKPRPVLLGSCNPPKDRHPHPDAVPPLNLSCFVGCMCLHSKSHVCLGCASSPRNLCMKAR